MSNFSLAFVCLSAASLVGCTTGQSGGPASPPATALATPPSPAAVPPPVAAANIVIDASAVCPRCEKIFDGASFDGWEASPSTWSIVDRAMRGEGGTSRAAYTKKDYGNVRLIVTSRMNPVNRDHLGILFWGNHPDDPDKPQIDLAGWLQFMPPHGAMWDYHPPKHHNLKHETLQPGSRDFTTWHTTELLLNLDKGTMRAAVNGVETTRYAHPTPAERSDPNTRIIAGPIGMMRHGKGASEYRDIYVEDNPPEDTLYTVREPAPLRASR